MKPFANFIGAALLGALFLTAAPNARAQVGVNINIGAPNWGPRVPYGTQYYYIPEIDGYYDLYSQQYLVYDDGYWVPLPQLYGYDPYRFHPVVIAYRGREPWCQRSYYHQHYAYQPYRNYGRSDHGNGYYGHGHNNYPSGYYGSGRGYNDHDDHDYDRGYGHGHGRRDHDDHDDHDERGYGYGGGYSNGSRSGQPQYSGYGGPPQSPQPGSYGNGPGNSGGGEAHGGHGNGQGNNEQGQDGSRHGRD